MESNRFCLFEVGLGFRCSGCSTSSLGPPELIIQRCRVVREVSGLRIAHLHGLSRVSGSHVKPI